MPKNILGIDLMIIFEVLTKTTTMKLNKGDLVMTEHGLAWYKERSLFSGRDYYVYHITEGGITCSNPTKATRPQVEQYLKENGWAYDSTKYGEWYRKHYVWDIRENKSIQKWGVQVPFVNEDYFDTAPAMLAEAILMARLLNATKD